jgi:hypothetical protein
MGFIARLLGKAPKHNVKDLITQRGLRPLGNKKRLVWQDGEECLMYAALFRDRASAERYGRLFADYARQNPPPCAVETMVAYVTNTIYQEKFALICPYPDQDADQANRAAYGEWAHEAMLTCNETLRQHGYFSGYSYETILPKIEAVYSWDIYLPRGLALDSPAAQELLTDPPGGGFGQLKLAGK